MEGKPPKFDPADHRPGVERARGDDTHFCARRDRALDSRVQVIRDRQLRQVKLPGGRRERTTFPYANKNAQPLYEIVCDNLRR